MTELDKNREMTESDKNRDKLIQSCERFREALIGPLVDRTLSLLDEIKRREEGE